MTGRLRKRRIGMICLATALPLVADEACMDDRFGWCHAAADVRSINGSKTSSWEPAATNATAIDLLYPFERSYGNVYGPSRFPFRFPSPISEPDNQTCSRRADERAPSMRPDESHHSSLDQIEDESSREPQDESALESSKSKEGEETSPKDEATTTTELQPGNHEEVQKVDYASKSVGAILLESSNHFSGTGHLLQKDKDKYAIVACENTPVDVTIGLSEDILVKQVKISNYERYSGSMRHLHLYSSTKNTGEWSDLGIYELDHSYETTLDLRSPVWARYLKLEFLDYYGNEYYCTVSQISVFGSTMLQGFHEQWDSTDKAEQEQPDGETAEPAAALEKTSELGTTAAEADSSSDFPCEDSSESLKCFEQVILKSSPLSENRSLCFSSISRAPGSKEQPIKTIATKQQHVPLSTHTLADLEQQSQKPEAPVVDETRLRVITELLKRFPNAKCLESILPPKLKSRASSGQATSHDGGLEPIFTKFSAEIKALQSDVAALSEYASLSDSCYQTLFLELVMEQHTMQNEFAERLERLEQSGSSTWYAQLKSLVTTNISDAMNSEHGKRLGSVLTSSVWNDASFCCIVCVLLLAVFLYLGGSRYQGRITIRRRSLLESTQVTDEANTVDLDVSAKSYSPIVVTSAEPAVVVSSTEPAVAVSSDEVLSQTINRKQTKKQQRKNRTALKLVSLK